MKQRALAIILVLAILLVIVAWICSRSRNNDGIGSKLSSIFLKKSGKKISSILFVGDSITEGDYCYSNLIRKQLTDKKVDVLAKGGMRTKWMLDNLKTQLQNNNYDRVYIWGGVNDMFSSVAIKDAISNIQQMVDLVTAHGGEAYVILGYDAKVFMDDNKLKPTSHVPTKEGMVALKNRYIEYQKELRRSIRHATVVPLFDIPSSMGSDGIHPGGTAHKMIAAELMKDIR